MDADLTLVIGLVLFVLTIPSLLSAFTEGRTPRFSTIMVMVSGGMIVMALSNKPGGYSWDEVPRIFASVIGRFVS